jgi:hypothetical protein
MVINYDHLKIGGKNMNQKLLPFNDLIRAVRAELQGGPHRQDTFFKNLRYKQMFLAG